MLMMVITPIVAFLMAESFSISGLQALICCAFTQSMYASPNLASDRSRLVLNVFRALSYTTRSVCDVLIGINFALYFFEYKKIGFLMLFATLTLNLAFSFGISY